MFGRRLVVIQDLLLRDEIIRNHHQIVILGVDRHVSQVHLHDTAFFAGQADPMTDPHQFPQHQASQR